MTKEISRPSGEAGEEAAPVSESSRGKLSTQVEDFLEQLQKFVTNLKSARSNMEGQVELAENGVGPIIDTVKTPADYQDAGESCSKLVCNCNITTSFSSHFNFFF